MKSLTRLVKHRFATQVSLPELSYGYKDLAPVLSEEQLTFHHAKHHQTYVTNLNNIQAQIEEATNNNDFKTVAQLQPALKFNLGGHLNHSIYWANLAPINNGGGVLPGADSPLTKAITETYGGYDAFIQEFNKRAALIQGSGWGWLGYDKLNKTLRMFELGNQELPEFNGCVPLLTIDMWEHAFYIDYRNVKVQYLSDIWKIVNWAEVEKRFIAASQ